MKRKITLILAAIIGFAGTAQEVCSSYYPLEKGTSFQITSYGKNDKVAAVVDYTVKDAGADWALLSYELDDDKGKLIASSEYKVNCVDDGIEIDFKSLGAPGVMEQYKDMEVDVSGTNVFIPNNLEVGRQLPDAEMRMAIKMNPITMNMNFLIMNRKVSSKETVTTPAGTFDCVVLTYDFESKMGIKVSGSAKQWLAEGVGMVKTEDYNKKGKMISRSELTKFSD